MSGDSDNTMTAAFLRHILPDEGYYACFVLDGKRHQWFDSVDRLADAIVEADRHGSTVYHACASFRSSGGRTQKNAQGAAAFWLDIDLAPKSKYEDVTEAAEAVVEFCRASQLPGPTFVGSGNGLHVYWSLASVLDPALWLRYASGLRSLSQATQLDADQIRTCDIASILRTPGTHNRKNGLIRPVQCGPLVGPYPIEAFERLLHVEQRNRVPASAAKPALAASLGATYETEPRYAEPIAEQCAAIRNFQVSRGNISEPLWYAALGVLAFCNDGDAVAQSWSSGYEGYTEAETAERLARARRLTGATTCEKFHSLDPKTCEACPHFGKIKSPISLGKVKQEVGAEVGNNGVARTELFTFGKKEVDDLPELPHDFYWSNRRELVTKTESVRGNNVDVLVSSYPIYLASIQTGEVRGEWTMVLRQFIPERGWFEISIAAKTLFGSQSAAELADRGANIHEHGHFLRYIRHAVDLHYRTGKLTTRYDQFGWKDDDRAFLYGLDLYTPTGVQRVIGNDELQTRCKKNWVGPCQGGDLETWKRTISSLFAIGCEPQSVALLASFAAPLMRFQDSVEGGAIVHLVTRESGTGKSTALIGAASVWGHREGLGLTNDDTRVSKALTLGALGNLPVIYDEMTIRDPAAIATFVRTFTEGRDKMRATQNGQIKHTASTWQTLMISGANMSLVDVLSAQNDPEAPAYRIMEFSLEVPEGVRHHQGDKLRKMLMLNSGYAGQVYLAWLTQPQNLAWVKERLQSLTQQTWEKTQFKSPYRFWVRTIAAIAMAGVIVKKLGLVDFSVDRIMEWLLAQMIERATPVSVWAIESLNEFLRANRDSTLAMAQPFSPGSKQRPLQEPKRELRVRYEQSSGRYFIAQSALREWTIGKEQSYREMVNRLVDAHVVTRARALVTLAAGTDIPGGQVWCLEVDGTHAALGGISPVPQGNVVPLARAMTQ